MRANGMSSASPNPRAAGPLGVEAGRAWRRRGPAALAWVVAIMALCAGCSTTGPAATPVPEWVNRLPQEPGVIYAVGSADQSFYSEEVEDATHAARVELGRTIRVSVESISASSTHGQVGGFSKEQWDQMAVGISQAAISGSQRIAWWTDVNGVKGRKDRVYVLVKLTPSMVVENIKKMASAASTGGSETSKPKVSQADIEKAFDELDKAIEKKQKQENP